MIPAIPPISPVPPPTREEVEAEERKRRDLANALQRRREAKWAALPSEPDGAGGATALVGVVV